MKRINLNQISKSIKLKFQKLKDNLVNFKYKIIQSIKSVFIFENSLGHLSKILTWFYITSIGFEEINFGRKNPFKFKICALICFFMWIATLRLIPFLLSNHLYSLISNQFLPRQFKTFHLLVVFIIGLTAYLRTEFLLGEINYDLKPFKVFYFLINNLNAKHKLNQSNYKRLAILSRLTTCFLIDYGSTLILILTFSFIAIIAILSRQLFWILELILVTPTYIASVHTSSTACVIFIIIIYYKLRFDQINQEIKSVLPNGVIKVINKTRERKLISLINKHNLLSNDIQQLNLMMQNLAAALFIILSLIKIISLYLLINLKESNLMKVHVVNIFIIFFLFWFWHDLFIHTSN